MCEIMPDYAKLCLIVPNCAILCQTMLYCAKYMPIRTFGNNSARFGTVWHIIWHSVAQCGTFWHSMARCQNFKINGTNRHSLA